MDVEIKTFVEEMQTPIKKFTITKLREREEVWRALWSWLGDDVKYFLLRIGSVVRVVRRDYKGSFGELGEVKFVPGEYEISVYEKHWSETEGKMFYETKVVKIPASAVMWIEFVSEQELAEEVEKFEVEALEPEGLSVG